MYFELAKKFGKEAIYGLGLFFIPIIFMPILGYGAAEFQGELAGKAKAPATANGATSTEAPAAPVAQDATPETPAKEETAKEETTKEESDNTAE